MSIFGHRTAASPGAQAARIICDGFATFTDEQKRVLAEILVRLVPSLAAQGDRAAALPLETIKATLWKAVKAGWTGVFGLKDAARDFCAALETGPEAAPLREFCSKVAASCAPPEGSQP
jgi:hypothetical protein